MELPQALKDAARRAIIEGAVGALGLVCPVVPAWAWELLITNIMDGTISPAHIAEFLEKHNISVDYSEGAFPDAPPTIHTENNINKG